MFWEFFSFLFQWAYFYFRNLWFKKIQLPVDFCQSSGLLGSFSVPIWSPDVQWSTFLMTCPQISSQWSSKLLESHLATMYVCHSLSGSQFTTLYSGAEVASDRWVRPFCLAVVLDLNQITTNLPYPGKWGENLSALEFLRLTSSFPLAHQKVEVHLRSSLYTSQSPFPPL